MKPFNPIGWCHFTVNFWWGCVEVSPACAHCYARQLAMMWSKGRATWGKDGLRWIRTEAAIAMSCAPTTPKRAASSRRALAHFYQLDVGHL